MKIVKAIRMLIREARMNRVYAGKGIAVSRGPRGTLVSCLETEGGGGGGGTEYDGYFALKIVRNADNAPYLVVCDGATWNDGDEMSGPSLLHLNQANYWLPSWRSPEPLTASKFVVVSWRDATDGDPDADPPVEPTPEVSEIALMDAIPADTYSEIHRIIGRAIVNGTDVRIQQDHTSGVLYATVFTLCKPEEIGLPLL